MLSVRLRKRAVPVAWRVRSTPGHLGFGVQQELRNRGQAWVPEARALLWAAERLEGTAQRMGWGQQAGGSYRRRLPGHWTVPHAGGALSTGEVAARIPAGGRGAAL